MEVPVLKTWIHSLVMDALVTALVDPGKLDVNLTPHDRPTPGQEMGETVAQGVLTVTLSATQPGKCRRSKTYFTLIFLVFQFSGSLLFTIIVVVCPVVVSVIRDCEQFETFAVLFVQELFLKFVGTFWTVTLEQHSRLSCK
jgi:hypothetical protein